MERSPAPRRERLPRGGGPSLYRIRLLVLEWLRRASLTTDRMCDVIAAEFMLLRPSPSPASVAAGAALGAGGARDPASAIALDGEFEALAILIGTSGVTRTPSRNVGRDGERIGVPGARLPTNFDIAAASHAGVDLHPLDLVVLNDLVGVVADQRLGRDDHGVRFLGYTMLTSTVMPMRSGEFGGSCRNTREMSF